MKKFLKNAIYWVRRRSYLPLLVIGSVLILVLYLNDETSITRNVEYDRKIRELKQEIALNNDSAQYYRQKREALLQGTEDLERLAREQYNMQRVTEDVYLIEDEDE